MVQEVFFPEGILLSMERTWYSPMLLTPAKELPVGPEWGYEVKLDGYRAIAFAGLERQILRSRNGNNFTNRFIPVARDLIAAMNGHNAVLDGEMVGHNRKGQPDFTVLQTKNPRPVLYIFDLLSLDEEPLLDQPLSQRRDRLREVFVAQEHAKLFDMFTIRDQTVDTAREHGQEGVIAKKLSSHYRPGVRTPNWRKMKFKDYPTDFSRR
ncbi:MAG: polymerase LigD, ligase domain protein [Candidatus Saccharibacteria bacterium]|nr:polymerase LigD, ligase domain protein [Candidatus Saccharibacteria bacterium]